MNRSNTQLRKELVAAGAAPDELAALVGTASALKRLGAAYGRVGAGRRRGAFAATLAAGLVAGALVVAWAQTSLPGSWLYPAKLGSEWVAVRLDPNYRATLMMRRSQEVEVLVNRHAESGRVLAALGGYRTAAAAYKAKNYAAFAYCRSQLEQAASAAPPAERGAIASTLASLADTD